ncbi:hypothetical protein MMC07_001906 [Pseudocyphellaria aurata]|nr:hypothetical protein [Pseudocyphellaria aurata]
MDTLQKPAPAAMEPSQGPFNSLKLETTAMADTAHAISVIFGLCFFGCDSRVIRSILVSYGFDYSLQDVLRCIERSRFVKHDNLPHQLEGTYVDKKVWESGVEANLIIHYVNGEPTLMTCQFGPPQAQIPRYGQLLSTDDGRRITVEIANGWFQIRTPNHPYHDVKLSL